MRVTKRKIPERHNIKDPRKMAKWEKHRVGREYARTAQGKKPLAEPLTMSKQGMVEGNLILKNGRKNVPVSLMAEGEALQGVYRFGKRIIVARSRTGRGVYPEALKLYELKEGHEMQLSDSYNNAFFEIPMGTADLGHMYLPEEFRHTGLAGRHASRTDRHYRQQRQGKNTFWMSKYRKELFDGILKKIGYNREKVEGHDLWIYHKKGKVKKLADMNRFHLIEAIDPKTGKLREYVFPVEGNK